jgi:Cobalamin biosynthesis protein CobT VWA domain
MAKRKKLPRASAQVQDKARAAVSEFRKLQPTLTAFARHLTNNPRVMVQVGAGVPRTDGKVIYFQPPIELGENRSHEAGLCDSRDPATRQQLCSACKVREQIMATIYHEISHIAFQSFLEPEAAHIREAVGYIKALVNPGYAEKIMRRIVNAASLPKSYMELSAAINPYFKGLVNCLEDVRINHQMHRARPGTKAMMDAQIFSVMTDGIRKPDDSVVKWTDMHLNQQVSIGAYLVASGHEVDGWLAPEIVATMQDEHLRTTLASVIECESVHEAFQVSWDVFTQLRALGYYETTEEQEEEQNDDTSDEDDSDDDGGTPPPVPTPQPRQEQQTSGGDSDPEEPDAEDAGDPGEDSSSDDDEGTAPEAQPDGEGEQPEEGSDDSTGGDDPGSEAGDQGEAASEGEGDEAGGDDERSSDEPESSDEPGEAASVGEGDDTDPSAEEDADTDDGGRSDESDGEPDSADESDAGADDGDNPWDDGEPQPGDDTAPAEADPSAEGSEDDGDEAAEGRVPVEIVPDEDAEAEMDLDDLGLHAHAAPSSDEEEGAIEVAIIQGEYFEKPSVNIKGVNEWRYENALADRMEREWHAWADIPDTYRKYYGMDIDPVPEAILAPALMRTRIVFAENKRTHRNRNQRSGRLDARVLGRRAWNDDDRLFGKKIVPGNRDYLVIIGLDISGSTAHSDSGDEPNLKLIKQAAMAQADLLARAGVPFAMYAHTGSPTNESEKGAGFGNALMSVDIYHIKDENEPWDNKARERLEAIGPSWANIDGHTLEFYRKVAEKHRATDKVILYYSDGKMPLENFHEELEILQREIATCQQRNIKLLGVGIRTDSPRAHGLDTVQIDSIDEIGKVVTHLEKTLVGAAR